MKRKEGRTGISSKGNSSDRDKAPGSSVQWSWNPKGEGEDWQEVKEERLG